MAPAEAQGAADHFAFVFEKSDCLVVWLLVAWFSLDEESVDASGGRKPVPCGLLCRRCLVFEERHRRGVEDDLG